MTNTYSWIGKFRQLWAASALTNLGDGLLVVALPLVAVQFTRSPLQISGITLAATAPYLLVSLFAGAVVDRWDRRHIMAAANLMAALTIFALVVATANNIAVLPSLYVAAFILGSCETLASTSASTLVPSIVPRKRLDWAYSRLYGTESALNEFIGPPLAAILVTAGATIAFGAIGAAYVLVLVLLLLLRGSYRPARTAPTTMRTDIVEGLRFVWHQPILRTLSLLVAVMAACWAAWSAVLVLYVVSPGDVGLGSVGYGVLLTTLAIGGLLGTVIAGPLTRRLGRRTVILTDLVTMVIMLGVPALTSHPYAIGAAMFVGGAGSGMWNIASATLRQAVTPDHLRGRVSATGRLLGWGPVPIGALLGGLIAELTNIRVVFAVGACLVAFLLVPARRTLTTSALAIADNDPDDPAAEDQSETGVAPPNTNSALGAHNSKGSIDAKHIGSAQQR